jgi:hypothetical protein
MRQKPAQPPPRHNEASVPGQAHATVAGPDKARVQTLFVSVNGLVKQGDFVQADNAAG